MLQRSLEETPADVQLTSALANVFVSQKKYGLAQETYTTLTDTLTSRVGMSLVAHLQKDDKQALVYAAESLAFAKADTAQIITANERYIQALIWNGKYRQSREAIAALEDSYPENQRVAALKATLGMYTGTFRKSIAAYKAILEKDSTSFDGNLGIANAYRAQGNLDKASGFAKKTLTFYPRIVYHTIMSP